MKRLKTTLWLSFGLVSATLCLAMMAYSLGLLPDGHRTELESRAKVAEALAVQLAGAINRRDAVTVEETLKSVVERNDDVLSVAFRREDGSILISQGDHEGHWIQPVGSDSTPTHVSVPLVGPQGPQGRIEISFGPPSSGARLFDIPVSFFVFLGFLAVSGFVAYSVFLRRSLNELDPGRVIPERVQRAFDTLTEGVVILDEYERILLANSAFGRLSGSEDGALIGSKINTLPWRMLDGRAKAGGYPWHAALREGKEKREDTLSLRAADGTVRNLVVNATVFSGEKKETIGAIVTAADMTGNQQNAEQLAKAVRLLEATQAEVDRQKQELDFLANHDSLTGCLNRRAFFARFEQALEQARRDGRKTAVIMADVDGLRSIKENFGPAIVDAVVTTAADVLRKSLSGSVPIARYGGEGFCAALFDMNEAQAQQRIAEAQHAFEAASRSITTGLDAATLSVGLAVDRADGSSATELVRRADHALHTAVRGGTGHVATWQEADARIEGSNPRRAVSEDNAVESEQGEASPVRELAKRFDAVDAQQEFLDRADKSILRAERNGKPLAILKVGVTSWDYLEEALGQQLSHSLLRMAGRQVELALREHDNVTLLAESGEMLVELCELDEDEDVTWIVKRILDGMRDPIRVGQQSVFVVCKVGAALYPHDGADAATLIRHAGVAMRRAKEDNLLGGLKYYSADMTQNSLARLDIETGTREALQNDEFELVFQPIVDASTREIVAAECLLRCNSPRLKGVRIDQVIDIAERSSLISEIDMWVLTTALEQMQNWCSVGLHLPKISINLSAKQLNNIDFMDRVYERIQNVSFSPSRVQIEVTETAQMDDVDVAAPQLKRLQQLGVHIALDDFGTGQASLTYLQRLHPDLIKIDRSFVDGLDKNHANATMVGAMTVMAHCLGLLVVAEGVETEGELEFLRETGCDSIQGYLISRPLRCEDMTQWMKTHARGAIPQGKLGSAQAA
ncbi:MAG: EAL domain-containing protein [Ahrensia sp.]|nr:EAL domain-containing protein [Ahrensia sp.]